jgi:hypothetical protein
VVLKDGAKKIPEKCFDIRALKFMHVLYTYNKRQAPVRANKAVSGGVWILVWRVDLSGKNLF